MIKKIFLLTIALLCAVLHGAWAKTEAGTNEAQLADVNNGGDTFKVPVVVCSWDDVNKRVVKTQTEVQCQYFGGDKEDDWLYLGEKDKVTWYYDDGPRTIRYKALVILGEVHLVLTHLTTVSVKHIKLEAKNNAKLHIHNQWGDEYSGTIDVEAWYTKLETSIGGMETNYYNYYDGAAAVGGGRGENMGSLYMHGCSLYASTHDNAAAIGGGEGGSIDQNHEIVVYAGKLKGKTILTVTDLKSDVNNKEPYSAAIGGSDNNPQGGPITVYGGTLHAVSDGRGAGIGGGEDSYGGTVNVYGGQVIVERTWVIKNGGAGIGGGYEGGGGDVHIYGGSVEVVGGERSAAIGGYQGHGTGTIEFAPNLRVTAGGYDYKNQKASPERVFTSGEREAACQWRNWAKIEACDHTTPTEGDDKTEAITYSINDDDIHHTKHCRYCNTTWQEEHQGPECVCGKTSFYRFTVHHPDTEKDKYDESSTIAIALGMDFYLPGCKNVPKGYTFKGWEMNPAPNDVNRWAAVRGGDPGADINIPAGKSVKTYLGQDKEVHFYARFLYDFTPTWTWAENGSSASVTLSHKDLEGVTLSSTDADSKVSIEQEVLKDEADNAIGKRYTATCTYAKNGYDYTFTDTYDILDVPATVDISLRDNADNSETISGKYNCPVNATLTGRTLYKDGSWNTLCLPFDLVLEGSPLAGATVKTLESSDYDISTGELTLNFTTGSLTTLRAGTPYLVKWESGENLVNPVFSGVTVSTIGGGHADTHYVDFVGSFSPVSLEANDKTVLYLGASNKLYYPSQNRTMGSCRAVFRLHNGLAVGDLPTAGQANARAFVLNFGDGEATGIVDAEADSSLFILHSSLKEGWYDLQGRRLNGKPTEKGIYINNGIKVVIK